jgi:hypothetical protein
MSSLRSDALGWLSSRWGVEGEPTYTSKFYVPERSWTGQAAWWLEIPRGVIDNSGSGNLHLLCQAAPGLSEFHYLRVPADFLRRNLSKLALRDNGRVSLFLSAEPSDQFVERRGSGKLPFASFLVS